MHEGITRSFGSRVGRLYHRWQNEAAFPFDFGESYEFAHWAAKNAPADDLLRKGRNIQSPVATCGWPWARDPRDPSRFCHALDGHGEIIGYRGDVVFDTTTNPWTVDFLHLDRLATQLRSWPGDAAARRAALVELALPDPENTWAHRPLNPGMCLVSSDLHEIVKAILDEKRLGPVVDQTPPSTVATLDPGANAQGWHAGDVVVSLTATDLESRVQRLEYVLTGAHAAAQLVAPELAATTVTAVATLDAEGATSIEYFATDGAGNAEEPRRLAVRIDRTPPDITAITAPPPNADGWSTTDVVVSYTATDALSGVLSLSDPQLVTTEGARHERTGVATDLAGNSASAVAVLRIDRTAPSVTIDAPLDGAAYLLGAAVTSSYVCADGLSGLRACAGPAPSGASVDTATVGPKQFTVTAADVAGNPASRTHAYAVRYGFPGFQPPVAALPAVNVAKAGRTVPLKWVLHDGAGVAIADLGAVASLDSAPVGCGDVSAPGVEVEGAAPTGNTTLRIEDGVFVYNWQTSEAWSGCRVLELGLRDGTTHRLAFRFR